MGLASYNIHDILKEARVQDNGANVTSMYPTQGSSYEQTISKSDNSTRRRTQLTGNCHHEELVH